MRPFATFNELIFVLGITLFALSVFIFSLRFLAKKIKNQSLKCLILSIFSLCFYLLAIFDFGLKKQPSGALSWAFGVLFVLSFILLLINIFTLFQNIYQRAKF